MKIKRSHLPADIAAALTPRTFAQELPVHHQNVMVSSEGRDWKEYMFIRVDERRSHLLGNGGVRDYKLDDKWKPILEIEDDAPEPEKKLPEPKPGAYFFVDGRFAFRYIVTQSGLLGTERVTIHDLASDWQPLSEVIEQAARAKELEVELQRRNARIAELDEALGAVERTADEMADRCEELEAEIDQLEKEIIESRKAQEQEP